MSAPLSPAEAPDAALGRSDPTRRWGLRDGDGALRFPGLTRPEAERVADQVQSDADPARMLVRVALPVILSDGAGPHLVDADGRLTLAVGPHPADDGWWVAIGEPRPAHTVGVVRPGDEAGLVWHWVALREVGEGDRAAALDALLESGDRALLAAWERGQRSM